MPSLYFEAVFAVGVGIEVDVDGAPDAPDELELGVLLAFTATVPPPGWRIEED